MKSLLKSIVTISFASALLLLTGCASVFKGTDQVLTITSDPDGATVRIDGKPVGVTPLSTKVKKNSADSIMIEKDGFRTETMPLEKKFDGVTLLSIFWDLGTTDFVTGAAYEYQPSTYHFKMKKDAKWTSNFGRLDRNLEEELSSFVLINFYNLKRPHQTELIEALSIICAAKLSLTKQDAAKVVKPMLQNSKTPLDLLKQINDHEQSKKPR